ncbi:MAG: hypothetical protein QOH90_163 [Actinomycetota bacterium]|nr:hypothetical protein [Actinomycetota bacterium]
MNGGKKKRWLVTVCAAVLVLCLGGPVSADDYDASDPPKTSGPLIGSPIGCEDDGPAHAGRSKGQTCSWSYQLVPAETAVGEDFSAYWLQMEITPGRGVCAKQMSFSLTLPADARIVSAVPARSSKVSRIRPISPKLVVDGGGTAPLPGTVSQDLNSAPGRIGIRIEPHRYFFTWIGNSREKAEVAIGLQIAGRSLPPNLISAWSETLGLVVGTCSSHAAHPSQQGS